MDSNRFKELFFEVFSENVEKKEKIQKFYDDVVKRYSVKNRYYHNLEHIYSMCDYWEMYKHKFEYPNYVFYAIIYHDIIYKTRPGYMSSSEQMSAMYFFYEVFDKKWFNLNSGFGSYIMLLIESTEHVNRSKTRMPSMKNSEVKLLLDIDLSIIGSSEEEYNTYCKNIRKEYNFYPNFLYNKGRLDVLQELLKREKIFLTKEFSKFEKKARINIQNEINLLTSPKKKYG